jgi:glucosamine 6-phosphate synthetase-like amidotransferase/phosphosugar isomerase protein
MCGQLGVICGTKERQPEERSYLKWLFIYLLLLSEKRGPYATGISWLKDDGSHSIFKRPMRATMFIKEKEFVEVISKVDDNATWLAGHTRWPTRGDVNLLANAHPIRAGVVIGTHNGTITNADGLFEQLDLPRFAEVDSEVIFRMADATLRDGRIDLGAFKKRLALCRGLISAVMASKLDPKTVVVIKGNKPLELRYHPEHRAIVYASDPAYLDVALTARDTGWQEIKTRPMSLMTFDCDNLPKFTSRPFTLAASDRLGGFLRFTGGTDNE